MRRYTRILALLAVLMTAALPAMAYGPWWGERGQGTDCPRFERGQGWADCPYYGSRSGSLTDDQKAQLKKVDDEFFKKTSSLRDQMRLKRAEMAIQLNSDNPDEKKIMDTQKQISSIRDQIDNERIRYQLSVKKIVPDVNLGRGSGKAYGRGWGFRPCARI